MNTIIINEFKKLVKQIQYEMDHETNKKLILINSFRLKHIKNAVKIISQYNNPITLENMKKLEEINGIGKGILKRIEEILKNGYLSEIKSEQVNEEYEKNIENLMSVFGIGRSTAKKLVSQDIKDLASLKKAYEDKKIKLSDNIIKGLKYYDSILLSIPREEMLEFDIILHKYLTKIDIKLVGLICGSYRRLSETSGDIDFLFIHPDFKTNQDNISNLKINYIELFVNKLIKDKYIVDSLTTTVDIHTKYMGFIKLKNTNLIRRIDIRFVPYDSFYSAMMYFTGSGEFNKKMRLHAIQLGYLLNEYGLYKKTNKEKEKTYTQIKIESEKDIFDELNMEYLEPKDRL